MYKSVLAAAAVIALCCIAGCNAGDRGDIDEVSQRLKGRTSTLTVNWYLAGAKQGDADSQYKLAVCYDTGDGIDEDDAEAVKWFTAAAEQGHAESQYNLAICYEEGEGVPRNDDLAFQWYKKAAELGFPPAQYSLSLCYSQGIGTPVANTEAYFWLLLAYANEAEDATKKLDDMEKKLNPDQLETARDRAVRWMDEHR
jgi:TPR repeat protein